MVCYCRRERTDKFDCLSHQSKKKEKEEDKFEPQSLRSDSEYTHVGRGRLQEDAKKEMSTVLLLKFAKSVSLLGPFFGFPLTSLFLFSLLTYIELEST